MRYADLSRIVIEVVRAVMRETRLTRVTVAGDARLDACDQRRKREPFDPLAEGARHGLPRHLSCVLWDQVCADVTDGAGRCDDDQAQRRFHGLASHLAGRNDVGK
jgi:hypothetical protein